MGGSNDERSWQNGIAVDPWRYDGSRVVVTGCADGAR
jgi:hypothetical protein